MNKIVIAILAVVVIGGGAFVLMKDSDTPNTSSTNQPAPSPTPSASKEIIYNDKGFSPAKLTVTSGTTVTVKNVSDEGFQMNSDPHPVHTINPELNVGAIAPGQSKTFTATKKGTFGYHNHLEPEERGSITVE